MARISLRYRKLAELRDDPNNSRTHTDEQIELIRASLREFGPTNPILLRDGQIVAGHARRAAAELEGLKSFPTVDLSHLSEEQARAYVIADNRLAEKGSGWDYATLLAEHAALEAAGYDFAVTGFDEEDIAEIAEMMEEVTGDEEPEPEPPIPEPPRVPVSEPGDVWRLGDHLLVCGDSTDPATFDELDRMSLEAVELLHADPPYGMGKSAQGVENDNHYREKLDAFQTDWWTAVLPRLYPNASAYVWGNAPDLWRWWWSYLGTHGNELELELRNEIVWDKGNAFGMSSDLPTMYPIGSERCLFFQLGRQFDLNINTDAFPEAWEPLRSYLAGEADAAGIDAAAVRRLCGVGMFGHWFTRSQFTLIPESHYLALQEACPGHFPRPWPDVKAEWDQVRSAGAEVRRERHAEIRSYFDNTHAPMYDVWQFPRVPGEERAGHPTPKPVAMIERCLLSSCPEGGAVIEPFAGSGSTLIAAERTGRRCLTVEILPKWTDVVIERWQDVTGGRAKLLNRGRPATYTTIAKRRAA